ncbi:MAG: hypothetical protein PHG73_11990 [Pygmaiobacter sp.]|nr:hypothetical protein [Pygmaiobacter sp.]
MPYNDEKFVDTIIKIGHSLYNEKLIDYFEPVGGNHVFLRSKNHDLLDIINRFKLEFDNDFLIENQYSCEVFLIEMGGYVRFNLATGFEIFIKYSDYGTECFHAIKRFLLKNACIV